MSSTAPTAGAMPVDLSSSSWRLGEKLIKVLLALCALVSVLTTIGIVIALLVPSLDFFGEVSLVDFLTGTQWSPLFLDPQYGVVPLVLGTLAVTFWACLLAVPCGLGAAIYLSEYAGPRVRGVLKPLLELLAGIPTIVYGFFALFFVTPLLGDIGIGVDFYNTLSAGLVIGVMILPTIASLSEDAMAAVPGNLRDGAYALGSSRFRVSTKIVVPAAVSGIVGSFVLGISRGIGETMIVLIAAGQQPGLSLDPRHAMETMAAFIAATGQGDIPTDSNEYKTIFAVGLTLFAMTFAMNMIAIRLVRRYREVYE